MDRQELLRRSAVADVDATLRLTRPVRLIDPAVLVPGPLWSGPVRVAYEHLPVVRDDTVDRYDDAVDAGRQWALPTWSVLPASPAGGGPFRFEVQRRGATSSGGVALGATVVLTVCATPPPDATDVVPVLADQVEVVVEVACTNDSTGQPDTIRLPGLVEPGADGTWRVTLTPAPGVVGCLYGALSGAADFAGTPPTVLVTWRFDGYRPERPEGPGPRWRRDVELRPWRGPLPLQLAAPAPAAVRLDALQQEAVPVGPVRARGALQALRLRGAGEVLDGGLLDVRVVDGGIVDAGAAATHVLSRTTVVRTVALPFSAPCAVTPEAYVETGGPDGPRTVGCVDWTQLGRLTERAWAEVPELAVPGLLRVFRSLREAGVHLVLPSTYRVSRDDDDPRVPCALWLTSSEASTEIGNRATYATRLVPAIDPWQWRNVTAAVEAVRPGARLVLPHERSLGADVVWRGVDGLGSAAATPEDAGFAVTLSTPLLDAPVLREALLRGAVGGAVAFRFEDGAVLPSVLALDLDQLAGPWPAGPVAVSVAGGVATVRNLTGSTGRLLGLGVPDEVPLDLALPPGGPVEVPVGAQVTSAVPHVALAPDAVEAAELRTYLDDLHTVVSVCVAADVWGAGAVTQVTGTVTVPGGGGAQLAFTPDSAPVLMVALTRPLVPAAEDGTLVVRLALTTSGPAGTRDLPPYDVDLRVTGVVLWLGPDRLLAP